MLKSIQKYTLHAHFLSHFQTLQTFISQYSRIRFTKGDWRDNSAASSRRSTCVPRRQRSTCNHFVWADCYILWSIRLEAMKLTADADALGCWRWSSRWMTRTRLHNLANQRLNNSSILDLLGRIDSV